MTTNQNRQRGKRFEKVIAKRTGGTRLGILGGTDVIASGWAVECKTRKSFVAQKWMSQAIRNCPAGKTPIVIIHVTGDRHQEDLVMLRWQDWIDWYGNPTLQACKIAEEVGL